MDTVAVCVVVFCFFFYMCVFVCLYGSWIRIRDGHIVNCFYFDWLLCLVHDNSTWLWLMLAPALMMSCKCKSRATDKLGCFRKIEYAKSLWRLQQIQGKFWSLHNCNLTSVFFSVSLQKVLVPLPLPHTETVFKHEASAAAWLTHYRPRGTGEADVINNSHQRKKQNGGGGGRPWSLTWQVKKNRGVCITADVLHYSI